MYIQKLGKVEGRTFTDLRQILTLIFLLVEHPMTELASTEVKRLG